MLNELIKQVYEYGYQNGIHDTDCLRSQLIKLGEDFDDLCDAVERGDDRSIRNAIGHMLISMVHISAIHGRRSLYGCFGPNGLELSLSYAWRQVQNQEDREELVDLFHDLVNKS